MTKPHIKLIHGYWWCTFPAASLPWRAYKMAHDWCYARNLKEGRRWNKQVLTYGPNRYPKENTTHES